RMQFPAPPDSTSVRIADDPLEAWRRHPDHVETMQRGHAEFYASGFLQICKVIREVGPFEHS
ncbi:MAG: hypothetical protein ACI4XG_16390, partial [Bradyrhizobium sp.]